MDRSLKITVANKVHLIGLGIASLLGCASSVFAAPLDDLSLQQQGDVVLATIRLTEPVRFLRSTPSGKTRYVEIYYERVPSLSNSDTWLDSEIRRASATSKTPSFTVTTRDQAVQPKLVVEFAREVELSVNPSGDGRGFVMSIKAEKTEEFQPKISLPFLPEVLPPVAESIPSASATKTKENVPAEYTSQAYALMLTGRNALSTRNNLAAIDSFNRVLLLPPNQYSQDAQEWVGVSRERAGQTARAKAEYELYLKLYTTAPGVPRVKQRLANLATPKSEIRKDTTVRKITPQSFVQGGISSRYYYGETTLETTYPFNNGTQTSTYTLKDQSSLISNVDVTARSVDENYDNRLVFRDVVYENFLPGQINKNRVNSAYYELKNRTDNYSARLGRQTPVSGGVMGRFDGVSAGYGLPENWRVNGVAGQLVDFTSSIQPTFYGLSLDKGSMSIYLINQMIEGILDRRAIGAEYKYFEGSSAAYAVVDYDIYFNVLNTTMITATLGVDSTGTTFNFMADYRKSPAASTRNALNGASTTSVQDLLTIMNQDQLHQLALSRTGSSAYSQLGVMQKLTGNWQVGGDIKLAKTSGLPASGSTVLDGILSATPDTGLEKTVTAQLIASNQYSAADITSVGGSYVTSDYIQNGGMLFVYNRTSLDTDLALDSSWNFYSQIDNYGSSIVRNTPTFRVTYRMLQTLSLDAEIGTELTTTNGPYQSSISTRIFGSTGFRLDF